jgi:hypothetical protein
MDASYQFLSPPLRAAYRKLNIAIRTWQGRTQEKKKLGNEEEGT